MATPRRRIIRPATESPQPDPARQRRLQKLRARWLVEQGALERWWKRLRRAFNAIEKHQRSIKSLDKQFAQQGEIANGQDH
jgi:hypothetical protein